MEEEWLKWVDENPIVKTFKEGTFTTMREVFFVAFEKGYKDGAKMQRVLLRQRIGLAEEWDK